MLSHPFLGHGNEGGGCSTGGKAVAQGEKCRPMPISHLGSQFHTKGSYTQLVVLSLHSASKLVVFYPAMGTMRGIIGMKMGQGEWETTRERGGNNEGVSMSVV